LPIPPNYYDDLASRYGLSEEELVSLRKLNLLYERDDDGSFRHAYMTVSKIGLFRDCRAARLSRFRRPERPGSYGRPGATPGWRRSGRSDAGRAPVTPHENDPAVPFFLTARAGVHRRKGSAACELVKESGAGVAETEPSVVVPAKAGTHASATPTLPSNREAQLLSKGSCR
jgi:hypothetical protein